MTDSSLHIVCCIKQVPDTADIRIDPDTNTLIRSGVESVTNPFDVVALESSVRLRERYHGKVTALSMGPPQAEACLREALSMGADEAVLLSDRAFAGADTLATSYTLARAIERIHREAPVDLILCGKQAIDGDTAQVGPGLATRLGFTQLTYVVAIHQVDVSSGEIVVKRKAGDGWEIIRGRLPALLTVELELAKPRRAPLPRLIYSTRAEVRVWGAEEISADPEKLGLKGSPTWVKDIFSPSAHKGGPCFDAQTDPEGAVQRCIDELLADEDFAAKFLKGWSD